jgi:hypothetical protein
MDKVLYVENARPVMLILGNSRADNGFDPGIVARVMGRTSPGSVFNMGLPGADARVLMGILLRLDRAGALGGEGIKQVVISLDEALLQKVDTLGQEVFFADRPTLWRDGEYHDWLRANLRLYGYSENLRQLREPGSLSRFVQALRQDTDPVGGSARLHAGYRAGIGGLQDNAAALRQEAGSRNPPDAGNLTHFWRMVALLRERGVEVAVTFPPLLTRNVLYMTAESPEAAPYQAVLRELRRWDVPIIVLDREVPRRPAEFVNAGHLNDLGAQRYSALLGDALAAIWPVAKK